MSHNIKIHHAMILERPDDHYWVMTPEIEPVTALPTGRRAAPVTARMREIITPIRPFNTPRWTMEAIAAELDIDPDDADTLLDIMMYRVHMPTDIPEWNDGTWLYGAPTITHAREWLLEHIAAIKGDGQVTGVTGATPDQLKARSPHPDLRILAESGTGCPVRMIKEHSPRSRAHIAERRERRDAHRRFHAQRQAVYRAARARPVDLSARESAEQFRARQLARTDRPDLTVRRTNVPASPPSRRGLPQ